MWVWYRKEQRRNGIKDSVNHETVISNFNNKMCLLKVKDVNNIMIRNILATRKHSQMTAKQKAME